MKVVTAVIALAQLPLYVRSFSLATSTSVSRISSSSYLSHHIMDSSTSHPFVRSFIPSGETSSSQRTIGGSTSALSARARGLEVSTGGATPTEGGMTLYLKAGPDGTSVGDCPFAQYVRMVLIEKGLEYRIRPCGSDDDKPTWLLDYYGGSIPALRHKAECYVESDVIAQYLDFFFQEPSLSSKKRIMTEAQEATSDFFPALAKYLKHTPDSDEADGELQANLEQALQNLEDRLTAEGRSGPFFVGNGELFTLIDCSMAPKLYHMLVGLEEFKQKAIDIPNKFPSLHTYMETVFARPSFVESTYPKETIIWGWSNARNK